MKAIFLTKGKHTIVDDEDYDELSNYNWYCGTNGYAQRTIRSHKISMAREIVQAGIGVEVDHINGDRLDNRRLNLRCVHASANRQNRKLKSNSSGYIGVYFHKTKGKFYSDITVNYKKLHLGSFDYAVDAAKAYDRAATMYFGPNAKTNFHDDNPKIGSK